MRLVFAQGGPRAGFIDNYFRVIQPTAPICNTGTLSVSNPMCLPIVWSVVSGPSNIIAGQGTNTITIQKTGNGTAVIRATAGGYFDEKTAYMGTGVSSINYTQKVAVCEIRRPYFYGAVQPIPFATNYDWYSKDESSPSNPFILQQSMNVNTADFPLRGNGRNFTVRVVVTTPCGTVTSIDQEGSIYAPNCQGTNQRAITIIPNPATDFVNIQLKQDNNNEGQFTNTDISKVIITNRYGTVITEKKFATGTKVALLDFSKFSSDIYMLKVWDGEQWITSKIIKN